MQPKCLSPLTLYRADFHASLHPIIPTVFLAYHMQWCRLVFCIDWQYDDVCQWLSVYFFTFFLKGKVWRCSCWPLCVAREDVTAPVRLYFCAFNIVTNNIYDHKLNFFWQNSAAYVYWCSLAILQSHRFNSDLTRRVSYTYRRVEKLWAFREGERSRDMLGCYHEPGFPW